MDKHKLVAIIVLVLLSASAHNVLAERINLPKDAEGWTIFAPSPDSRIVYISETGNDSTCQYYSPSDANIGGDPFVPSGAITACKTWDHALTLTRNGYPDWILFKRGGVYQFNYIRNTEHNGRSATEPFLVSSYGSSGALPSLRPVAGTYIWYTNFTNLQYIVFANLEMYADVVDPDSPNYSGNLSDEATTIFVYTGSGYHKIGLMFEGMVFKQVKFSMTGETGYPIEDFTLRRNVFQKTNSGAGAFNGGGPNSVFEENIFYHSGWYDFDYPTPESGDRTRDHAIYMPAGNNSIVRNNIIIRPCSIGMKITAGPESELPSQNFVVSNNLVIDANIAFGFGGNHGELEYRINNLTVKDNIYLHGGATNANGQGIAWGFTFDGLDSALFSNNLMAHSSSKWPPKPLVPMAGAGLAEAWGYYPYKSKNVTIANNIFVEKAYNPIYIIGGLQWDNFTFRNNIFDKLDAAQGGIFYYEDGGNSGYGLIANNTAFENNTYNYDNGDIIFWWPFSNGVNPKVSQADWKSNYEPTAKFEKPNLPDPSRDIPAYMQHLGLGSTIDDFIAHATAMNRYNWDPRFTAPVINDWIRAGYFIKTWFRVGSMPVIH